MFQARFPGFLRNEDWITCLLSWFCWDSNLTTCYECRQAFSYLWYSRCSQPWPLPLWPSFWRLDCKQELPREHLRVGNERAVHSVSPWSTLMLMLAPFLGPQDYPETIFEGKFLKAFQLGLLVPLAACRCVEDPERWRSSREVQHFLEQPRMD